MKGKAADCHLLLRTTAEIKASGDSVGCFFAISPKGHEYTASIISSMQMHSNLEFPSFFVQNIKKVYYFLYFYKSILLWIVHIQHRWKVPFVRADWLVRELIASNIATCEQPKGKNRASRISNHLATRANAENTLSTLPAPVSEVRDVRDLTKLPSTYDLSRFATVCQIRKRPEDLLFMSSYANLSK